MVMLVLDLDETVFVTSDHVDVIDFEAHQPGKAWIKAELDTYDKGAYILLINPEKLSDLIEHACTKHDGVLFLTAGFWNQKSIISILIEHLDLSQATCDQLQNAHFFTPFNTHDHFDGSLDSRSIQKLTKNNRLTKAAERHPRLKQSGFRPAR